MHLCDFLLIWHAEMSVYYHNGDDYYFIVIVVVFIYSTVSSLTLQFSFCVAFVLLPCNIRCAAAVSDVSDRSFIFT